MKTFLQTLFFFLLVTQICFAQWYQQNSGTTNNLNDVLFFDTNYGIAIGDGGIILLTIDGGLNWIQQTSGTSYNLLAIYNNNTDTCWIVGNSGNYNNPDSAIILETTDGGLNWIERLNINGGLNDIHFVDGNTGYAVGVGIDSIGWLHSVIFQTSNSGSSWIQTNFDSLPLPRRVQFINTNTGWILCKQPGMGCQGDFYKSSDGGNSWYLSLGGCWNDFQFIDMNNGIVVTTVINMILPDSWGQINRTTDSGQTWSADSIYSPAYDVFYIDQNTVVVLGHHYGDQVVLYWSTDTGATWTPRLTGIYEDMNRMFFTDETNGWMVGNNGTIYHTTNGGYPIPVELNLFTATANGKEVTLSWSTATELNNQGFEIQRKFGNNTYVTVGSVKGHGTTTSPNNYTYVDKLTDAGKYFYRLKQIDYDGKYNYSQEVEVNWSPFITYKLEQNYPNPFNPTTIIGFGIPENPPSSPFTKGGSGDSRGGFVTLKVYDILGNEVKTLINKEMEAGYHSIDFNASDLPSGVYFYQLKAGEFIQTRKMVLIK